MKQLSLEDNTLRFASPPFVHEHQHAFRRFHA